MKKKTYERPTLTAKGSFAKETGLLPLKSHGPTDFLLGRQKSG